MQEGRQGQREGDEDRGGRASLHPPFFRKPSPSTPACQVGEAYIFLISTASKEVWEPVEAMLEVASYPDFNIAAMSFNFWAKLAHKVWTDGM